MKSHDHASQTPLYDCNNALYICCFLDLFYSILCCIRLAFYPVSSRGPTRGSSSATAPTLFWEIVQVTPPQPINHIYSYPMLCFVFEIWPLLDLKNHAAFVERAQPQRGRHQGRASCRLGASGKRPSWKSRSHRFLDRATYRGLLNIPRSLGMVQPRSCK